ncbi:MULTISPECIES: hypothetical protein [Microvirga]|uniref:hypothetical protein n=1 Tax=Microvirga TaxID=186650 RepID=UPI001B38F82A|nr:MULTISPECIES: hypothetical protein [unclassified Microvirga]MBQ0820024.1 hypothetical protein [Microvirga sp. HBU67558]
MGNGRCYLHGGRTPKGKDWHKPQPGATATKTQRKLKDIERAAKKRAKRLDAMTLDERKRYEDWRKTHRPGPRATERAKRAQAREARERLAEMDRPAPQTAEAQALAAVIETLRHQAQQLKAAQDTATTNLTDGIFG